GRGDAGSGGLQPAGPDSGHCRQVARVLAVADGGRSNRQAYVYLRLVDVGHVFAGQSPLFEGISAAFDAGAVVALTGPSGSGKSTLLSIIAGWLRPTHGRVDLPPSVVTAWVFQNPHGVARRTALDHVALPVVARGATRAEADAEALELLDAFHL